MSNRRSFLQHALGLSAGLFASHRLLSQTQHTGLPHTADLSQRDHRHGSGPVVNTPVITPDIGDLPYTMDGGVKVFRLTAQVMKQQIAPNKTIDVWASTAPRPAPPSR